MMYHTSIDGKSLTIPKSKHYVPVTSIMFGSTPVDEVQARKHLGITISEALTRKEHIEVMVTSAGKCVGVLNAFSKSSSIE